MDYNENEWHISKDGDNQKVSSGQAQVPSSLLPTVLHRLGLTPEQTLSELSLDDLVAKLKNDDWEVRVAAVRALEKLAVGTHVELLVSALDDEDGSVRAAAVHVLGNEGERAPLQQLVAALRDPDWHVRETAVLALGKQGQRVPIRVFTTALYDTDQSVREAAGLVMQQNPHDKSGGYKERTAVSYGRLWEQKTMQADTNNTSFSNGREGSTSFENVPYDTDIEYSIAAAQFHGMHQQMQEYAPQERAFYEYHETISSHGEKITPLRRSPRWGWWAAIAIAAILFFALGRMTMWVIPVPLPFTKTIISEPGMFPFQNPKYNWIAQEDIASALHLAPRQIAEQLKAGKHMTDIAATQRVSEGQLQDIELKALAGLLETEVKAGDTDQNQANQWIKQFKQNPQIMDKITTTLFLTPTPTPPPVQ